MGHYFYTSNRFSYQYDDISTLLRLVVRLLLDRQQQTQRSGAGGIDKKSSLYSSELFIGIFHGQLSLIDGSRFRIRSD